MKKCRAASCPPGPPYSLIYTLTMRTHLLAAFLILPLLVPSTSLFTRSDAWKTFCLQAELCAPQYTCSNPVKAGDWTACMDDLDLSNCLVRKICFEGLVSCA